MQFHSIRKLFFFFGLSFFINWHAIFAQTAQLGNLRLDDNLRELQLTGKLDPTFSFASRPLFYGSKLPMDSVFNWIDNTSPLKLEQHSFAHKGRFIVLPALFGAEFNSHHPYGWNNSGMIAAKGLQASVSAGVFAEYGPLSIQLQPQIVYAANPGFEHNINYGAPSTGVYTKLFPGQSSIRLNTGAVSVGVSTENIYWGPGRYNSLLMSNNAPGFAHLTFNTRRPIKTGIGSFEWQLVFGKLYEDTSVLLENKNLTTGYYNPLTYGGEGNSGPYNPSEKWRYFNGISLTWQPKWIKGLFLGANRVAYAYNDNLNKGGTGFFQSYLPIFFGVFREDYAYGLNLPTSAIRYKQMFSFHARYLLQKSNAEIYGEYGWGDNHYNLRDFVLNVPHSSAFIFGIKKMVALTNKKWLDIQAELTQMSQPADYVSRSAGNWYGYQGGYTNQSRILGAGVGMGNNVQTVSVTHIDGWNRIGFLFERLQHDPLNYATHWTDFSLGILGQKRYERFLISGQLQFIESRNYAWESGNHKFNLYATVNLSYFF